MTNDKKKSKSKADIFIEQLKVRNQHLGNQRNLTEHDLKVTQERVKTLEDKVKTLNGQLDENFMTLKQFDPTIRKQAAQMKPGQETIKINPPMSKKAKIQEKVEQVKADRIAELQKSDQDAKKAKLHEDAKAAVEAQLAVQSK